MKRILLLGYFLIALTSLAYSQACQINFESDGGMHLSGTPITDVGALSGVQIVDGTDGGTCMATYSFDVINETVVPATCPMPSAGGVDDITMMFMVEETFDAYGGMTLTDRPAKGGSQHNILYTTTGIRGNNVNGQNNDGDTSTGDVSCYSVKVKFADHIHATADEVKVNTTSINTSGETFESTSIVFLDAACNPYGTATYCGFYEDLDGPGGTHPGVLPDCTTAPTVKAEPWAVTGTGVWTAQNTGTVDITDPCNPISATSGPDNNSDPTGVDAGLAPTDVVTGFIFRVCLEDVAIATADGVETTSQTNFTSTLNGFCFLDGAELPTELVEFQGKFQSNSVELSWHTLSELNNSHFELERSFDGKNFTSIAKLQGAGTTVEPQAYSFIDVDYKIGANYYRLKQVDTDEGIEYSNVIIINTNKNSLDTKVFPNPTSDALTVEMTYTTDRIQIIDITGRVVAEHKFQQVEQAYLNTANLVPGAYFVAIQADSGVEMIRFVKK